MRRHNSSEFIEKSILIHGDRYNYYLVDYVNARQKVKIICKDHGVFEQVPYSHAKGYGCSKCADIDRGKNRCKALADTFLNRAKAAHGDKYDYSKTEYKNAKTKVTIICPDHGVFFQTPHAHVNGKQGCSQCANEVSGSWTADAWKRKAERSKSFESFKFYILKVTDPKTGESFFKYGRTYPKINKRTKQIPYDCEVVLIVEDTADEVYELEKLFSNEVKELELNYVPQKDFGGKHECFQKQAF